MGKGEEGGGKEGGGRKGVGGRWIHLEKRGSESLLFLEIGRALFACKTC